MPHPKIADVIRGYGGAKARDEWYGEWGAALLYRPIAFIIAPVLLRLSIGATSVTLVALALAVGLPIVALSGAPNAALAIGIIGIAVGILDCVDGTIARATGTVTARGDYLDFLTDVVFRMSLYTALGLTADKMETTPAWLGGHAFSFAAVAALLAIAARLCRVYGELMTGARPNAPPSLPGPGRAFGTYIFPFLSGLDSLTPVAMLAALYLGVLGWLVVWLLVYSAADFLQTQFVVLGKIK